MPTHFFDTYYNSAELYYGREVRPEFAHFLENSVFPSSRKALDLGCGDGRYTVYLAERGFQVHGIDQSAVGLAKLAALADRQGLPITTEKANLHNKAMPAGQYDLVVFATVLDHLEREGRERLVREILTTLKPEGYFYGEVFTRQDPGYLKGLEETSRGVSETAGAIRHYFAAGELRAYFADQDILDYDEFREEDLSHGPPHLHGWACILGRKQGSEATRPGQSPL